MRSIIWPILSLLLLLASAEGADVVVPTSASSLSGTFFRINELVHGPDGTLSRVVAPDNAWRITSLYYGAPVTNLVFDDRSLEALTAELQSAAVATPVSLPARPGRPQYQLDRWGTEHGLPAGKVRSIIQTRDGYLWAGTVGGLARFDGVRFTHFTEENSIELVQEGSIGRALFEDDDARLWIGTERGMLCRAGDKFVNFPGQEQMRGRMVHWLASRREGGFWIGSDAGLGHWDGACVRWHDPGRVTAAGQTVRAVVDSTPGFVWIGGDAGLFEFDLAHGTTNRFHEAFWERSLLPPRITSLFMDRRQQLWISGVAGLWRWDPDASAPVHLNLQGDGIDGRPKFSRFAEDASGIIWVSGGSERSLFQWTGQSLEAVSTPGAIEVMDEVMAILVDQENAIWIASRDGLFRLRRQPITSLTVRGSRGIQAMRSIIESSDGSLWMGDWTSFIRWSGRDITRLFLGSATGFTQALPVLCAHADGVWAAGRRPGILRLCSTSPEAGRDGIGAPIFSELGLVNTMLASQAGGLWMAASNRLYRTRDFTSIERVERIPALDILVLAEDARTNLWIGTANSGLLRLSEDGAKPFNVQHGLAENRVLALHSSADGSLWVGTAAGLSGSKADRFGVFGPDSGLPQTAIHGILEDDRGQLWLNHPEGISRVARKELSAWLEDSNQLPAVANYGAADGLLSIEVDRGSPSAIKSRDGRLWFLKRSELSVVDPAELPAQGSAPSVWIESVTVDGIAYSPKESLKLPPGAGHTLDVWFTTTTLHSPEKVLLRHQLAGHDNDWRDAGSIRRATYTNLRPGRYTFRAKARNHEGRWSESDAELHVEVTPLFWRKPLFQILASTAALALLIGLITLRSRRQRARLRLEELKNLDIERRRIARDMHDHLGAHLAGVALASGGTDAGQEHARQTLRELNELIWSVQPENDNLPSLVDFIANFSEKFLSAAGIEVDLELPADIQNRPLSGKFRHEVAAMLKETLRNVAQHAQARRVTIALAMPLAQLRLTIRDDGRGFSSAPRRGNGLRNLQSRAESLGGRCWIKSTPGQGTSVEFTVPLPK